MQIPYQFNISTLCLKNKYTSHQFRIRLLRKVNNFIRKEFKHLKTIPTNQLMTNLMKFERYIDYRNCLSSCISILANKNNLYIGLPETIPKYYEKYKTYTITSSWVCPSFYEINKPIKKIVFINSTFNVYT